MSEIITTLHPDNDEEVNLYPNIKKENIPNGSIDESKLSESVNNTLNGINSQLAEAMASITQPKYYSTLPSTDVGLIVYSDGYIYSWNGSAYTSTGILYQSTGIGDGTITIKKLSNELEDNINKLDILNIMTLFKKEEVVSGKRLTGTGEEYDDGGHFTSGYIAVQPNRVYYFNFTLNGTTRLALYNSSKTFTKIYGVSESRSNNILTDNDTAFIRFCDINANLNTDVITSENIVNTFININKSITKFINNNSSINYKEKSFTIINDTYLKGDGNITSYANAFTTDFIEVVGYSKIKIKCSYSLLSRAYAFYDDDYNLVSIYPNENQSGTNVVDTEINIPYNAKYLKLSCINTTTSIIELYVSSKNKWCVLGDSFTAGDSVGRSKSYPTLICNRNNMILQDLSANGSYAHYGDYSPLKSTNSYYYQNVASDVDYITLAYGLNELSTPLGDKNSTDNTTIWGAYNEMLTWLITNRPNAKIGIISNDSWMSVTMRNTLKSIAEYYGIGFLDLKGKDTPLLIGGKYYEDGVDINSDIVTLRTNQYRISNTNSHPNALGQYIRSTIIGNWLKTI